MSRLRLAVLGVREHARMYDGTSLAKLVSEAGFVDVAATPAGETRIAEPGGLNLREREEGSVYVEGVRS